MEAAADTLAIHRQHTADDRRKCGRSAVLNGTASLPTIDGRTVFAKRHREILSSLISDQGGREAISETRYQLSRRYASLAVFSEMLEAKVLSGASSPEFRQATGKVGPHDVLREVAQLLHRLARAKGGDSIAEFVALPDAKLAQTIDLLSRSADAAQKMIAAGDALSRDLEQLGVYSQRLARMAPMLGLERRPREITALPSISDSSDLQMEGGDRRTREERAQAAYFRLVRGHSR
jgi:hypothetical protein